MHAVLSNNLFFVKEAVRMFKAANEYDVLNPETQEVMIECREELGVFTKMFRFTDYKRMTPFNVILKTPGGDPILRVSRGISIFLSKVDVFDENEQRIGGFKQKLFSIGGSFDVLDANDQVVCTLKGKWTSWDFSFMRGEEEVAHVSKKWAGLGKELFTTSDNYMLEIKEGIAADAPIRILIMAAVMCIDLVLKE